MVECCLLVLKFLQVSLLTIGLTQPVGAREVTKACNPRQANGKIEPLPISELAAHKINDKLHLLNNEANSHPEEFIVSLPKGKKRFTLKVNKFRAAVAPPKGTVVYLCSGPAACMDRRPTAVPMDYDVVVSDYIGLGKNTLGPATSEMLSIQGQALAIKTIIASLKLSHYILFGQSFGTAVATITAASLAEENLPQPQAVVLEGVAANRKIPQNYPRAADRAWAQLTDLEQSKFKKVYSNLSEARTKGWVDVALNNALWRGPQRAADEIRLFINSNNDPIKIEDFLSRNTYYEKSALRHYSNVRRMNLVSACQLENTEQNIKNKIYLFEGLVPAVHANFQTDYCACRPEADFDSANYQIRAPILYIAGDADPASPIERTQYHFEHQIKARDKAMVVVKDGGHFSTSYELQTCTQKLFSGAFSGNFAPFKPPHDIAKQCKQPTPPIAPFDLAR